LPEKQAKVVLVDRGADRAVMQEEAEELAKVGAKLIGVASSSEEETIEGAKDADVILTAAAQISRRVMEALPLLKAVVRYGIGYDTIDVDAATDNGVLVVNIPDFCWEEVSNHTIALLLTCAKKLVILNNALKNDGWRAATRMLRPMVAIHGQTLGVIGCGNIGRMMARKAQCFGLTTLGCDPYLDKSVARECGITMVSLPELLEKSDFVSVHCLLNDETRHLIGEKELKLMKPTAYLINTARGSVIDEQALIYALQEKLIAGAGIDVFEKEPVDPDNPLLKMDNVVVTPHVASYSDDAFKRLRTCVGQEAARVISGRWPKNVVNTTVKPKVNLVKD